MDGNRFDAIVARLAISSRRSALRSLGGGALAAVMTCLRAEGGSADECLRTNRSCSPGGKRCCKGTCGLVTQACCLTNGTQCKKSSKCCSGNCERRAGRKKCHCLAGAAVCTDTTPRQCGITDTEACFCITGSDSTICGATGSSSRCVACTVDADCDAVTGEGSVCLSVVGRCTCTPTSATACVPRCGQIGEEAEISARGGGGLQIDARGQ